MQLLWKHKTVLQRGPIYVSEPHLSPLEEVAAKWFIVKCVHEGQRPRCFVECVDVLEKTGCSGVRPDVTRPLVDSPVENETKVVEAEKEENFVALSEGLSRNKVHSKKPYCRTSDHRPATLKR
ncbi:hypothetical protein MRX96_011005 [Rhipicephalus microplus]